MGEGGGFPQVQAIMSLVSPSRGEFCESRIAHGLS